MPRRLTGLAAAFAMAAFAVTSVPSAQAQPLEKVSIGALRLSSSGAVFIAREKGYFREQGIDVELKVFTAAQQVPVAVTERRGSGRYRSHRRLLQSRRAWRAQDRRRAKPRGAGLPARCLYGDQQGL
jgi:hypothetical protein